MKKLLVAALIGFAFIGAACAPAPGGGGGGTPIPEGPLGCVATSQNVDVDYNGPINSLNNLDWFYSSDGTCVSNGGSLTVVYATSIPLANPACAELGLSGAQAQMGPSGLNAAGWTDNYYVCGQPEGPLGCVTTVLGYDFDYNGPINTLNNGVLHSTSDGSCGNPVAAQTVVYGPSGAQANQGCQALVGVDVFGSMGPAGMQSPGWSDDFYLCGTP